MDETYRIEGPDLETVKKAIDEIHAKRNTLSYPFDIVIQGFWMGTRCQNRDHLVWFRHGFELAREIIDRQKAHETAER